jgi:anti-sigma factor RsiW
VHAYLSGDGARARRTRCCRADATRSADQLQVEASRLTAIRPMVPVIGPESLSRLRKSAGFDRLSEPVRDEDMTMTA